MQKGNITLNDLVSLISPAGRVRIFDGAGENPEKIFDGYRADLIYSDLLSQKREVQHFAMVPEFNKRNQAEKRERTQAGEKLPVTPENAGEYRYTDLCMRLFTDIYLF